jgi:DNA (cytosine-5)-methyltransferase 1
MPTFYEFFAGGGMVRSGLGPAWRCLFANDFDHKKGRIYRDNWGDKELRTADVGSLKLHDVPCSADLAWASFPCQDLSLAGVGAGLKGDRSGTFWPFWKLMKAVIADGRLPSMIVLENVCGTLTSHEGTDFTTICNAFQDAGYSTGALVIDASLFVPHSRPRLFIVCVRSGVIIPDNCRSNAPSLPWHTKALRIGYERLPPRTKANWIWWKMPTPSARTTSLADLIEDDPASTPWYSKEKTTQLIAKMSELNKAKLEDAKGANHKIVGGLYRRTRQDESGRKVQRAEIRFDDLSGCLRTPSGGSSRQVILVVEGSSVRARLISSRETARLMGLPETYILPENYNEAYHLTGDGVVVPVVRHLAEHIFEPVIQCLERGTIVAA